MPIEVSEAALLAQMGWIPTLHDLDELSENFITYFLIAKNTLFVAQNGGSFDL